MESDAFALRTAVFILAAALLSALTWTIFKDTRFDHQPFIVLSKESVSGLGVKARIYYKGVEVGVVEDIYFQPGDFDTVRILIHVDDTIPIAHNTYAQLALRGITGEYDLRLDNDGPLGELLATSIEKPGVVHMQSEYITQIAESLESALVDISDISHRVSQLLSDENQDRVGQMLESVADAGHSVSSVEMQLKPILQQLPLLADQFTETLTHYRDLGNAFGEQISGLDATLNSLASSSASIESLADLFQAHTLPVFDQSLQNLMQTSSELQRLAEGLRDDPQRLLLGAPQQPSGPGENPQGERP